MFITVLFGDYESLLFNPSCTVINLLENIKERCGYGETNSVLDLTDSTGLVLELTDHKNEDASKYLAQKGEYILVEKKVTNSVSNDPAETSPIQEITYVPLLNKLDKFPNYQTRVALPSPSLTTVNTARHVKSKKGKRRKGNSE